MFLMPSTQLDKTEVVQEQVESLVAVKVNGVVVINTFPFKLLAVQKK